MNKKKLELIALEEMQKQEDICNPVYHKITWCVRYNSKQCKRTCNYAKEMKEQRSHR